MSAFIITNVLSISLQEVVAFLIQKLFSNHRFFVFSFISIVDNSGVAAEVTFGQTRVIGGGWLKNG